MDRNAQRRDFKRLGLLSLSARRAWIEIALIRYLVNTYQSLSARRAWIEITDDVSTGGKIKVALRKESVDRNACIGFH